MKLQLLLISLFFSIAGISQDYIIKRKLANDYFDKFDFYKAIPMYEQLLKSSPNDTTLYLKLALSYNQLNDNLNAEKYYAFLVNRLDVKPIYLLNYAQALAGNGKYDKAIFYYSKYKEAMPEDLRGETFAMAYQHLYTFYRDSSLFKIKKAPFSSNADEFGPAYWGNSIVFASDRSDFSMLRSTYNWTQSPYLDLYIAKPDTRVVNPFSKEINSVYHEGPVSFNRNLDTIIFTRSNYYKSQLQKNNEGTNTLSLFQAIWDKGKEKWINIQPLSINNDQYSVEHPTLSPDGRALYFASDMPGGFGGFDLYVSDQLTNEKGEKSWKKPVNLGASMNSKGDEVFPFCDNAGNLWYASNGIPGLGGLDIFFSGKTNNGFKKPINPGYPMNTRFDDFGYITQDEGRNGYLSSNRNNFYHDDDIYSISLNSRKQVVSVVDAKTGEPVSSARVEIIEERDEPKSIDILNENPAILTLNPYKNYILKAECKRYKASILALTVDQLQIMDTITIAMVKEGPSWKLNAFVYSANDKKPIPGAIVEFINLSTGIEIDFKCDINGLYHSELQPETSYKIRITNLSGRENCSTKTYDISTKGLQKDSIFSLSIPVYCTGDLITLENILYDLDKFNIRPDAALILDKLLKLMNDYPKMKIELRSHTDSRGSSAYNLILSENRAKSAVEYLFSKGIAQERIIGKGYGETVPINRCKEGVSCSEVEHMVNRRTEFKILEMSDQK